jgi:methylenetetrahydrofolate--tRNA-(uracil-5-)-methyltransferase
MTATELAGHIWHRPAAHHRAGRAAGHVTGDAEADSYQPMNVNFGLFPPLPK